jgi:hypothetical protein
MDASKSILETKNTLKTLSSGQIFKKNGFFPTLPPGPWNRFSPPASAARSPALLQAASGAGSDPAQSPQSAGFPPSRTGSVEE